jgi:hypothetical protein
LDGTAWSITPTPHPGAGATLADVSCVKATNCFTVGTKYLDAVRVATLIERWDGTRWRLTPSPTPGGSNGRLWGVACPASPSCMAVGRSQTSPDPSDGTKTLAERWNGKKWSIVATPTTGVKYSSLEGVACPNATRCLAVGYTRKSGGVSKTLVERWNGTAWSVVASPNAVLR